MCERHLSRAAGIATANMGNPGDLDVFVNELMGNNKRKWKWRNAFLFIFQNSQVRLRRGFLTLMFGVEFIIGICLLLLPPSPEPVTPSLPRLRAHPPPPSVPSRTFSWGRGLALTGTQTYFSQYFENYSGILNIFCGAFRDRSLRTVIFVPLSLSLGAAVDIWPRMELISWGPPGRLCGIVYVPI